MFMCIITDVVYWQLICVCSIKDVHYEHLIIEKDMYIWIRWLIADNSGPKIPTSHDNIREMTTLYNDWISPPVSPPSGMLPYSIIIALVASILQKGMFCKFTRLNFSKTLGHTRIWTGDLSICSRLLYHWAIHPHVHSVLSDDYARLQ